MSTATSILHINSYYIDNHLYKKLYEILDTRYNYKQHIYIPIKQDRKEENKTKLANGKLSYAKIIKREHTVFYGKKIRSLFHDIAAKRLHLDIDFIHAHNLFIDGGVAYHLKKAYGIKYFVSVRMTDIALQYKFMLHRRRFAREILKEAEQIIFISPLYEERLFNYFKDDFKIELRKRTLIIPNGIDSHWFDRHTAIKQICLEVPLKLLYIGQIIKRKNVLALIKAVNLLNSNGIKTELTVIGGSHPNEMSYYDTVLAELGKSKVFDYLGKITDHLKLQDVMANHHMFVMPSKNELFGLVYIEALSQNLPVVYSQNEGISPYLKEGYYGEEVNPDDVKSIADGIVKLRDNYSNLSDMRLFAEQFNWPDIANQYKSIYQTIHE